MTTNSERVMQALAGFTKLVATALEKGQDVSGEMKAGSYPVKCDGANKRQADGSAVLLVVIGPLPPPEKETS